MEAVAVTVCTTLQIQYKAFAASHQITRTTLSTL